MQTIKRDPRSCQHDKQQHTSFRADGSSTKERRPVKGRSKQMSGEHLAAVRHGIEVSFSPVPGGMEANREPEISRAPQGKAEEESNAGRAENPNPAFAGVAQVNRPKKQRHENCGWPKAHSLSECK